MTIFIYSVATILVCMLIFLSIMINITVITKYTFKKRKIKFRPTKRPRAAVTASPLLHDAIFAHHEESTAEVEQDTNSTH